MRSELTWSKEKLVAEIIRLRDREDALLKSVALREQDAIKAANERSNLRVVVEEQLNEITSLRADVMRKDNEILKMQTDRSVRPLTFSQVVDLVAAAGARR